MENFNIQTAQNITIKQNLAGISKRMLAVILDTIFLLLFYYFLIYLFEKTGLLNKFSSWAFFSVLMLPYFLYYPLLQYWNNGQTLGKQLMKIRVVKIDNSHPEIGDFLIRWILRFFEIYFIPGLGIIVMLFNDKRQRLGDIAAKTTVISEDKKQKISHSIFEELDENYRPVFPQVVHFKDRDIELIKTLMLEATQNKNLKIMERITQKIQKILQIEKPQEMSFNEFVETIIKDYNYYTGQ